MKKSTKLFLVSAVLFLIGAVMLAKDHTVGLGSLLGLIGILNLVVGIIELRQHN